MDWYFNPYSLILFICGLLTIWVAVYAWQRRAWLGAAPALLLAGITVWTVGYAVALGVHDFSWRVFWAKVQHIGIALTPVAMAVFVLRYAGYERWQTKRNVLLLAAIPFVGLILAWTNDFHGLIWADTQIRISGSLSLLERTYGPYFWLYFSYNYLVLLVSAVVFLRASFRGRFLYRRQAATVLIGSLCVAVTLTLDLSGLSPYPDLDLVPLGFSIAVLVVAWGVFRYRLLDIVPVARDTLVEDMSDGLIVLDMQDRVVDVNPAMQRISAVPLSRAVGHPIEEAFAFWTDVRESFRATSGAHAEITLPIGETERCYDLRQTPLFDRKKDRIGNMVVLRDITERKLAERELQKAKSIAEAQREKADGLLRNILPEEIAARLESGERVIADQYNQVTILFADVVDFTPLSADMTPFELVEMLNEIFSHIDGLVDKYALEKIKTIGDCYMVAAGVPRPRADHAQVLVRLAIAICDYVDKNPVYGNRIRFRIGINSGPVVAGVIGYKKFAYDLWGDAVNVASRMESHGSAGVIQVTQATYELIKHDFVCEDLGAIYVKGKGDMHVWRVLREIA